MSLPAHLASQDFSVVEPTMFEDAVGAARKSLLFDSFPTFEETPEAEALKERLLSTGPQKAPPPKPEEPPAPAPAATDAQSDADKKKAWRLSQKKAHAASSMKRIRLSVSKSSRPPAAAPPPAAAEEPKAEPPAAAEPPKRRRPRSAKVAPWEAEVPVGTLAARIATKGRAPPRA